MESKFLCEDNDVLVLTEEETWDTEMYNDDTVFTKDKEWDTETYTCWQNFDSNAEVNRYLMKVNWEKEQENRIMDIVDEMSRDAQECMSFLVTLHARLVSDQEEMGDVKIIDLTMEDEDIEVIDLTEEDIIDLTQDEDIEVIDLTD